MNKDSIRKLKELKTYEIVMQESLPDIHAEGILLRHRKTGARVLLIPCSDPNKVFTIGFRTPPKNSTGVAHIIEHTVLCGSRKYPLKDPFVELAKGSLNTFLNAMTYPDKTIYPVASMNEVDFRNLMNVYLDAVFYPNIYSEENIFRQEGWSRRLEKASDPIEYNGVVYNEMKGVFSSPDEVLGRQTFNVLFPDTPYGVESGGDPAVIPTLTYEEFLNFHRKYYHPSNSYLYLYGDMDMAETLSWIDENYLKDFDALAVDSEIASQKPFKKMKNFVGEYPVEDDEQLKNNTYLSFNAVTADPFDLKESIAFDVLDYALFSSPGAPVKQALLDSHVGTDVYGSNEDGILQPYYSIVAKGANLSDKEKFLRIIRRELKKQVEEGISRKALLAGISSLEFAYREGDYGIYPKGLMYGIDAFDTWLYDDGRPFDAYRQNAAYRALRLEAEKEPVRGETGYFEKLIEEKFLKNTYSAFVAIVPSKGLAQKREAAIVRELDEYKKSLTDKEIKALVKQTKDLTAFQEKQETKEDLACLPVLKRSDIPKKERTLENREGKAGSVRTVSRFMETNGVGYVTALFDASGVPEELIPYLGFLKSVIGYVDTKKYSYQDLYNEISVNTGGILGGLSVYDDLKDAGSCRPYFGFKMKALYPKMRTGFSLLKEIVINSRYGDAKRLTEILMETKMQLQMTLMQAGHISAGMRASAYFSSDAAFGDATSGIGFYRSLGGIEAEMKKDPASVSAKLSKLAGILFTQKNLLVSVTAEEKGMPKIEKPLAAFADSLPEGTKITKRLKFRPLGNLREGFETAGQIQFVADAGRFSDPARRYTGAMKVLRQMMNYDYLWINIRVKGGAYGCGANFRREGDGCFRTYRDPNLGKSIDVYEALPEYLKNYHADEDTMTKYVIGTISGQDIPFTPSIYDSLALMAYMNGVTQKQRQKERDEVLSCTDEDIRKLAPIVAEVLKDRNICVIGSAAMIRKEKKRFLHTESLL
ncbi:MAG: insulinase family protein [Lachnospiraceae bacterium]|jgi:Zn-dependent M16 (insulinase) family peptidase|nr:insulinase family protein [Lachnospiraceae bacterium]